MRYLGISTGTSRLSPFIKTGKTTWEKLSAKLTEFTVADINYADYIALPRDEQADIKDVGYFIGGKFTGNTRKKDQLAYRSVIALDIDHLDSWDMESIHHAYHDYNYVVHSTAKHCEASPRLRLVFPLFRNISADEYEPLARMLASRLGMDAFDDTTFQPSRIMFWACVTSDGDKYVENNKGIYVDPDELFSGYKDWQDFATWPHSSRVQAMTHAGAVSVEDPLTKAGVIGAFCRTYDIHAAIQHFELPYEPTEHDNRYRPVDATGPSGAVVYDEGLFMYSHHESDPAGMQNVNAWDLVRIHLFGDFSEADLKMPVMSRASSQRMSELALNDPRVVAQMDNLADEMDAMGEPDPGDIGQSGAKSSDPNAPPIDTQAIDNTEDLDGVGETGQSGAKSSDPNAPATRLTYDEVTNQIYALDNPSFHDCNELINRIAAAKLNAAECGSLAAHLRNHWPDPAPTKKDITDDIKTASKRLTSRISDNGEIADIEESLIHAVLNEHFGGGDHLLRTGRMFWTFNGGVWAPCDDERVRGCLQRTMIRLRKERPEDFMDLVAAVGDAKTSLISGQLWSMFCAFIAEKTVQNDPLALMRRFMPPVMNCLNGEVWFKMDGTFTFRKHDPMNRFTTQLNMEYDPDAECPLWDGFMKSVWSETIDGEDMQRHIEELGGYCLQMSRWLKTWVLFYGKTDTGKSTTIEVISEMLGKAAVSRPLRSYEGGNDHAEAGLLGKLLMVDDDFGRNDRLPDGFIKRISEEKPITANPKGKDEYPFIARVLPVICSNYWPQTSDVSDAFTERAMVLHFSHRIAGLEKSDQAKAKMVTGELSGILNRFVAGFSRLRARGAWSPPIDAAIAHAEWMLQSSPPHQFVSDNLVKVGAGRIKRSNLYRYYKHWSINSGFRTMGKQHFFEAMNFLLGPTTKYQGEISYYGWDIRDDAAVPEGELDDF